MPYQKDQWMTSFEGQLAILRPHLTERVLTTMALQAWHRHGTTDPIEAARTVVKELTAQRQESLSDADSCERQARVEGEIVALAPT